MRHSDDQKPLGFRHELRQLSPLQPRAEARLEAVQILEHASERSIPRPVAVPEELRGLRRAGSEPELGAGALGLRLEDAGGRLKSSSSTLRVPVSR